MNWNLVLLAGSQALAMTVVSLMLSSAALVAVALQAPPAWATLPLALQALATMLALPLLAKWSARHGRRPVFVGAALAGGAGLALAVLALEARSFVLFALAGLGVGVFGAASQYYRFAAAEAVEPARRAQAMALTLAGGVGAALFGPWMARATRDLTEPPFLLSFAVLVGVALLAALLGWGLRLPMPLKASANSVTSQPGALLRTPVFRLALAGGVVAYAIMGVLMYATPLAMNCARYDFASTATVIQWHLVAMFAPSFLTGVLIRRVGLRGAMLAGCGLLLAGIGVALSGQAYRDFIVALALVGVGWNFLYVGASALLAESCDEASRSTAQALNDSVVFLAVTLAALGAGPLVDQFGWERVNVLAAVPVVLLVVVLLKERLGFSAAPARAG